MGSGERPGERVKIPSGRGVQAGDHGTQINIFNENHFAGQAAAGGLVVVGEVPQEPVAFQPRAELLAGLEDARPGARVVVVRAVTGMRGVGKTHLAAEYARRKVAEQWRLVAWINAEEPAGVLAGLSAVAGALGLATADGEAAGRAVRHWLEAEGERCLLVFDNATDPTVLRPFIPAAGDARVIITSNEQSMRYLGVGLPVEVFTEQEALAFVAERTGLADTAGANVVAAELGYLPLALAQAAAVIAGQHIGYGTYLERLRSLPTGELLRAEEAGQYPRGVAAAVLLSVAGVQVADDTGAGVGVMDLVAVLSPSGVRRTVIQVAGQQGALSGDGRAERQTAEVVDRALARLAGVSLLTFSVDGSAVTAHRLVMRVIREQLAARGSLMGVCVTAAELLDELAGSLTESWHEDRARVRDLVEQIMALYGTSTACPADSFLTSSLIRLRFRAIWFLNYLADSAAQLIRIAEPLLADCERVLGSDHPDTLRTRNNLGAAYWAAGRTAEAIALHEQNLPDCERLLGNDHPQTLMTRSNLAGSYRDAGRTAEAIALHEQNLTDRVRVLGGDHPDTLATHQHLAAAYGDAGRTAEAIAMGERNVSDCERVLGSDHPDTLRTRNNLAGAYRDAGRTGEAIAMGERVVSDCERVLGSEHPDTLRTRNNLAGAYQATGRTAEAIAMGEQNLDDCERVLGSNHPHTLRARNNLAATYRASGHTGRSSPP
jgi:tetratricopeptide (TPR) repeat protein